MIGRGWQQLRRRRWLLRLGAPVVGLGVVALVMLAMFGNGTPRSSAGPISDVHFDQNLNAQVPLDLAFQDEHGQDVTLGQYLGTRPVILMLGYYNCPRLCNVVFHELGSTLSTLAADLENDGLALGAQYDVITVSIDPNEGPAAALDKQQAIVDQTGYAAIETGWHFLTGAQPAIDRLADTVGFHFVYDEGLAQFAHPAGLIVLTPQGKIASYLYDVTFQPRDVRLALVDAGSGSIGTSVDQILLLCYHYDPATGHYTLAIENVLRVAGIGTTLILVGGVAYLSRSSARKRRDPHRPPEEGKD